MIANIYKPTDENISKAAEHIKNGGIVAMPTETVYGLAGNVYDSKAIAKIFGIKNRPTFNPLISHIAEIDFIKEYAQYDSRIFALAKAFCPGPLTFVLDRIDSNPNLDLVCAGLKTIAVRIPNHIIALELIKKSGTPLAAPSANISTSISPTSAEHVFKSLSNKIEYILDGGACEIGLESTIIDLTGKKTTILRTGFITEEDIEKTLNEKIYTSDGNPDTPSSPGQLFKHYAPSKPLRINAESKKQGEFYIGFGNAQDADLNLSPSNDLIEAASNLFSFMHIANNETKHQKISISPIPNVGIGKAINDKLQRASR